MNRRHLVVTLAVAATLVVSAPAAAATNWKSVKVANARYHSVTQASKAGYSMAGEPCVSAPPGRWASTP